MAKELTPEEIAEQELADKITPLFKEMQELEFRKRNGVTLEKNQYIAERTQELDYEIKQLKQWAGGGIGRRTREQR